MSTNLNKFILRTLPFPALDGSTGRPLAQLALRLSCTHRAFAPLWAALGPGNELPALRSDKKRALARALIDVLVAEAYGVDGETYGSILVTSGRHMPGLDVDLCMALRSELPSARGRDQWINSLMPGSTEDLRDQGPGPSLDL